MGDCTDGLPVALTNHNKSDVNNKASLVAAIREAVPHYDFLRINQWPSRLEVNEGDNAETAPLPGGPGGDDAGPAWNANN